MKLALAANWVVDFALGSRWAMGKVIIATGLRFFKLGEVEIRSRKQANPNPPLTKRPPQHEVAPAIGTI